MIKIEDIKKSMAGTFLFGKYPESNKDISIIHPFADSKQKPEVIEAETARAFLIGLASGASVVVQNTLWLGQADYLAQTLGLENKIKIYTFDPDVQNSHIDVLNSLPDKSVHVLHPYDLIKKSKYLVPPDTLFFLNDKTKLGNLTGHVPKRKVISLDSVVIDESWFLNQLLELFGEIPLNIVIKKGHPSAAGDGVYVGPYNKQSVDIASFTIGQQKLIIEEFIPTSANFNVQYFIDSKGQFHFIGYGKQHVTDHGEYDGTTCNLIKSPHKNLLYTADGIAKKVANYGYFGFCGFDILEEIGGIKNYVVDANVRINASTGPYLVKDKLTELLGPFVHVGSCSIAAPDEKKLINLVEKFGGMPYSISSRYGNGSYKCFLLFGADSYSGAAEKFENFKEAQK